MGKTFNTDSPDKSPEVKQQEAASDSKDISKAKQEETVKKDYLEFYSEVFHNTSLSNLTESSISDHQRIYNRIHKIQLLCLQNLSLLIQAIFCGEGKKKGNLYICGEWTIAFEVFFSKEVNDFIMPGGWVNSSTKDYENDIISLHANLNKYNYYKSLMTFEEYLENIGQLHKNQKRNQNELWVQEKTPLSKPRFNKKVIFSHIMDKIPFKQQYFYYNKSGIIIGTKECLPVISPLTTEYIHQFTYRYTTIWKNKKSHICYRMPFFPQSPYMIFNMHLIDSRLTEKVIFVNTEDDAQRMQSAHLFCVGPNGAYYRKAYTTCPGGLINLPEADFSLLHGKTVIIQLEIVENIALQIIPESIKRLRKSGIFKIYISLIKGEKESITNVPFEEQGEYIHILADDFLAWLNGYNRNKGVQDGSVNKNTKSVIGGNGTLSNTRNKPTASSEKLPRIPKKIRTMAKVAFLHDKKISYSKIEKEYGIKHTNANNIVKTKIPRLTGKEKQQFDIEIEYLTHKYESKQKLLNEKQLTSAESTNDLIHSRDKNVFTVEQFEVDSAETIDEAAVSEYENATIKASTPNQIVVPKEESLKADKSNSVSEDLPNFEKQIELLQNHFKSL